MGIRAWKSPVGWAGIAFSGEVLLGVLLPGPGGRAAILERLALAFPGAAREGEAGREIASAIERRLSGRGEGPRVSPGGLTPFTVSVLSWMSRIPPGRVATYGAVASWMGRPGAGRAVGGAAARNPVPLLVPCHRVVGSAGRLVGFSSAGGLAQKEKLLRGEGVRFLEDRRGVVERSCMLETPP